METIEFNGKHYPKFQSEGNAAQWVLPFAQHFCKGNGLDIGYSKPEWKLLDAMGIEPSINPMFDAMNLPEGLFDYIFSSHCLEHVKENWYNVLDYWLSKLKENGILFLYLPHKSQEYWLPKNNRKHIHSFDGSEIKEYLESLGHQVFLSGPDLNNAFVLVCEKQAFVIKEPVLTDEQKENFKCAFREQSDLKCTVSGKDLNWVINRTKRTK